ncbi:helicase HerA-like domain-containing protein [Candidatus Palauibacter polyketidifaciens]|uniref:ATP-binding protein n=1 Tax=Candidatus Palauibacter polyketidifaciens TaxID=3056740 RepID=UPI00239865F6|nr:helicase HerA-like domain-containing protein [Candidatus Palauibacter polyketidifaciens]MDE2721621.1 DUF853 family protein [Candidatus Palauibacter polyketidifaciens]
MTESASNPAESVEARAAVPYADVRNPFSVDQSGAFAEYLLHDPEAMPDLAFGSRVLVEDDRHGEKVWLDGTVVRVRSTSPFHPDRETLLYMEDQADDPHRLLTGLHGPHSVQPMLVRVRLNQELTRGPDSKANTFARSAVQRPPSGSSRLFFPNLLPSTEADAPVLSQLLAIREQGIPFGAVGFGSRPYEQNGELLIYRWDIARLDNKHMFIVGESGSGKTVLLKHLALEIRQIKNPRYRVIMTDVQGDLTQLFLNNNPSDKHPAFVPLLTPQPWQRHLKDDQVLSPPDAIKNVGPFNLVLPVSRDRSDSVQFLKRLARNRGVAVHEIGMRLQDLGRPSDVEYLFRITSEQAAMLLDEEAGDLERRNTPVTIDRLEMRIRQHVQKAQKAKSSSFTSRGGTNYYTSTAWAALRALSNLKNYFDHHQPSMDLDRNPLDAFDFDGTTIVYLEHLAYEERLMWQMQLVRWLYRRKRDLKEVFVFFDEAHQIVPERPPVVGSRGTFDRLRRTFELLAREGRKFDIHLILSTQSPRDLHKIVPEQCPTRIVMKLDPGNRSYAHLDKESAMIAARFGHGQFWVKSPFNGTPDWVRIHGWAPPLPHQAMTPYWEAVKGRARTER